jgi:hypothetical protein
MKFLFILLDLVCVLALYSQPAFPNLFLLVSCNAQRRSGCEFFFAVIFVLQERCSEWRLSYRLKYNQKIFNWTVVPNYKRLLPGIKH